MHNLTIPAPAKLNLFLHIIGRRADGYHLLQTVFQFIDLSDEIILQQRQDHLITITTDQAELANENNLVVRAAKLLQSSTGSKLGADIQLIKRIPMGAGLGGGSSDAASTLLGLNRLWELNLSLNELAQLGAKLGADVSVFVYGHAAWAEGVGDQLQSIELPEPWYLIIAPPCHVSTQEIYTSPELTRNSTPITIGEFLRLGGRNDCELLVRQKYPVVDQAIIWLNQFAPAKMTGTGSCVFASFTTEAEALSVLKQLPKAYKAWVLKGLNISPALAVYDSKKITLSFKT